MEKLLKLRKLWSKDEASELMAFPDLIDRSSPPTTLFWQSTLARLLLSYVPMIDFLSRVGSPPSSIASFGSGSCAHEAFLASAFPETQIACHDITDKYIPAYLREMVLSEPNNIKFSKLNLEFDNVSKFRESFECVISVQTLEHIEEYTNLLELLSESVKPGGYLYLDAPYYHMDDEREDEEALANERARQWEVHEHYHLGFSPHKLAQSGLLKKYEIVSSGYYAFETGDSAIMNVFRNRTYSKIKGSNQFTTGLANSMKSALDVLDNGRNFDSEPYFERPATAFRLLLKKVR